MSSAFSLNPPFDPDLSSTDSSSESSYLPSDHNTSPLHILSQSITDLPTVQFGAASFPSAPASQQPAFQIFPHPSPSDANSSLGGPPSTNVLKSSSYVTLPAIVSSQPVAAQTDQQLFNETMIHPELSPTLPRNELPIENTSNSSVNYHPMNHNNNHNMNNNNINHDINNEILNSNHPHHPLHMTSLMQSDYDAPPADTLAHKSLDSTAADGADDLERYNIPMQSAVPLATFDIQIPFSIFEWRSLHGFVWIDIVGQFPGDSLNPTFEHFMTNNFKQRYGLHKAALKDLIAPLHMPTVERQGEVVFMLLRYFEAEGVESEASEALDSTGTLTKRVAFFISNRFIITVHRHDLRCIWKLRKGWAHRTSGFSERRLVNVLMSGILGTFDQALFRWMQRLDELEIGMFSHSSVVSRSDSALIDAIYRIKRRAQLFRRILGLTVDVIQQFRTITGLRGDAYTQDVYDTAHSLFLRSDELRDASESMINMHLSIATHSTNKILTILTSVSLVFLPLTFVTGVYGMNFDHIPELHWELGYLYFWMLELAILVFILAIFKWAKWF